MKEAISKFENMTWDKHEIRKHALTFDEEIFKKKIHEYVERKSMEYKESMKQVGNIL